jgi:hypothetical protein
MIGLLHNMEKPKHKAMKTLSHLKNEIAKGTAVVSITFLISTNTFCQLAFIRPNTEEINKSLYFSGKSDILNAISDSEEMMLTELNFIEEWMTNPLEFRNTSNVLPVILPEVLIEEEVELENWMTVPKWIEPYNEEIPIEKWMTSPMEWCK